MMKRPGTKFVAYTGQDEVTMKMAGDRMLVIRARTDKAGVTRYFGLSPK